MECKDIQEKLSVYIDDQLSPEDRASIEKHLQSCGECSAALVDLGKTVELLRQVEEVEPPRWLTQKTMAKIKAEAAARKGILRILFYPLHIKLPIEAVAVITIAITSIYVFKTIQPEIKPREDTAISVTPLKEVSPEPLPRSAPRAKTGDLKFQDAQPPVPSSQPAVPPVSSSENMASDARQETAGGPSTLMKEEKKTMPAPAGIALGEQSLRTAASAPKQKGLPGKERAGEREEKLVLTVTVSDVDRAAKETVEVLSLLGGKVVKEESIENRKVLHAELNSQKLGDLQKKLHLMGEVREKESDLKFQEGLLHIRIDIIEK